ncbi:hypothetical protein C1H46_038715 [Malus baccata]|uniref:Uncharacterized protein n=1 Tax=Malus baccata TaxID=106549 RepID=A0A540KP08_MALBA|nr:hypothetical protein C1H46_038715 [Malus baccata]
MAQRLIKKVTSLRQQTLTSSLMMRREKIKEYYRQDETDYFLCNQRNRTWCMSLLF